MAPGPGNIERTVTCIQPRGHSFHSKGGTCVVVGLSPSGTISGTGRTSLGLSGMTEGEAQALRDEAAQAQRRLWPTGEREVFIMKED